MLQIGYIVRGTKYFYLLYQVQSNLSLRPPMLRDRSFRVKKKAILTNSPVFPLKGDAVSMLTHIYPHKPLRKIEVSICNHQVDSPVILCVAPGCGLISDLVISKF